MEDIKKYFLKNLGEKRWNHTLRVLDTALELGSTHGINKEKIRKAALLHDCGKFTDKSILLKKAGSFDIILDEIMTNNTDLIHGPLGARIAKKEFGIEDPDILNAIEFHTTARKNMSILEKLIFIADFIEPERQFKGIEEVRTTAYKDIDRAIILAIDLTIDFLILKDKLISLDAINARNDLIIRLWKGVN